MPVLFFVIGSKVIVLQVSTLCSQSQLEFFEVDGLDAATDDLIELHSRCWILDVAIVTTRDAVSIYKGRKAVVKFDGNSPKFSWTLVI